MKAKIRKCIKCGQYTLKGICPNCNEKTKIAHPAKFSPDDPYLSLKIRVIVKNPQSSIFPV